LNKSLQSTGANRKLLTQLRRGRTSLAIRTFPRWWRKTFKLRKWKSFFSFSNFLIRTRTLILALTTGETFSETCKWISRKSNSRGKCFLANKPRILLIKTILSLKIKRESLDLITVRKKKKIWHSTNQFMLIVSLPKPNMMFNLKNRNSKSWVILEWSIFRTIKLDQVTKEQRLTANELPTIRNSKKIGLPYFNSRKLNRSKKKILRVTLKYWIPLNNATDSMISHFSIIWLDFLIIRTPFPIRSKCRSWRNLIG